MLTQLGIHHLRNLSSISLNTKECNVFIGANGSGKTSLLESLHLLSRGKSFRHHQPKRYISHHQPHAIVHATFADGETMAIQKSQDASTLLRFGRQPVYVQSTLARKLPTLLVDPSSMGILEVGSSSRRQLLDWVVFHVKQEFHSQWVSYQRLLKQRNALLRKSPQLSRLQKQELAAWDKGLASHAALITYYRQHVFDMWQPLFHKLIKQLLPEHAPYIQLRLMAGYNTDMPFDELLRHRLAQDMQMGYTRVGCHRADVQVLWVDNKDTRQSLSGKKNQCGSASVIAPAAVDDFSKHTNESDPSELSNIFSTESCTLGSVREQAANVLSRGEKKLLITALRLSQLPMLSMNINELGSDAPVDTSGTVVPLVLLDDITAELDERALVVLLNTLSTLSCQVFITSLDKSIVRQVGKYWSNVKVFHVKQGQVSTANILD